MPLPQGSSLPPVVSEYLRQAGLSGNVLLGVVKADCGACEDTLPLLDAALPQAVDVARTVRILAQEDPADAAALRDGLSPALPTDSDPDPFNLSRALGVEFTPTFFRIRDGVVEDVSEGFDPDGFHRMLHDLSVATGRPAFSLYGPGEARPRFRPG